MPKIKFFVTIGIENKLPKIAEKRLCWLRLRKRNKLQIGIIFIMFYESAKYLYSTILLQNYCTTQKMQLV